MTPDIRKTVSASTGRQKAIALILVVVIAFVIWQLVSLMGSGSSAPKTSIQSGSSTAMSMNDMQPKSAQLPKSEAKEVAMTETEAELFKLQQETQKRYLEALNELQMLKLSRDIAETNQGIMTAKLSTVTAEKGIVDLLAPPPPPPVLAASAYGAGLGTPTNGANPITTVGKKGESQPLAPDYVVISVTQLHERWSALIGNQGKLYSVAIGDKLPLDNSEVVSIDKSGVILEKEGERKKYSILSMS